MPGLIPGLLYSALSEYLSFLCCSLLSGCNKALPSWGLEVGSGRAGDPVRRNLFMTMRRETVAR